MTASCSEGLKEGERRRASIPRATSAKWTVSMTPVLRQLETPVTACAYCNEGFIRVCGATNQASR